MAATSENKPVITHCIFDMDGLLLDTESFYTVVQQQLCQEYGKEFTWELKAKMMGMKALEATQYLVDKLQIQDKVTPEEFLRRREEALDVMFPTTQLMPGVILEQAILDERQDPVILTSEGAERLLRHLTAHKVPFCLATSSHKRHFDLKTTNHKAVFQLFLHKVTGDQVVHGKPAPDIFLQAAEIFRPQPDPSNCLVFEDAPSGVKAGKAAGMTVVMVPHPNLDKSLTEEADVVLPSLLDFKPEDWDLPAFSN